MPVDFNVLQEYIAAGKRVFPVTAFDDMNEEEKNRGKKPKLKQWQSVAAGAYTTPSAFENAEAGMHLDPDDIIIDIDPRNGGEESLEALSRKIGYDLEANASVIVFSGRNDGGRHLYFKRPAHAPVRKTLREYPGIDFLSDKNYVVTAGSRHAATGSMYSFGFTEGTLSEVKHAPSALLDLLTYKETNNLPALKEWTTNPLDLKRAEMDAKSCAPAVQGESGDTRTFQFFCRMHDIGLSPQDAYDTFMNYLNPRCDPPWNKEDAKNKLRNAYTYARGGLGTASMDNIFSQLDGEDEDEAALDPDAWKTKLIVDKQGKLKDFDRQNLDLLLQNHPTYKDLFILNQFDHDIYLAQQPPWEDKSEIFPPEGRMLIDDDATRLRSYLAQSSLRFQVSSAMVHECLPAAAAMRRQHPVRGYLDTLQWDGISRIETWLIDFAGAEDNAYVRQASKLTLMAAIARVMSPGCKFDYMLVLEGAQGVGKSTLLNMLAKSWFEDNLPDVNDKDAIEQLRGKWIIEIAEMDAVNRAEAATLKAFLSRTHDRARLAYARRASEFPRQCIFIGTTNHQRYLKDTTRNRRFWPVTVSDVDIKGFGEAVDQLWAEAYQRYLKERPELYLKGEAAEIAEQQQAKRQSIDPWCELIKAYTDGDNLQGEYLYEVTPLAIGRDVLNLKASGFTTALRARMGDALRSLGWQEEESADGVIYTRYEF